MPLKSLPLNLRPGAVVSAFPPEEPGEWKQVETEEGTAWVRQLSQEERTKSELSTGRSAFRITQTQIDIGEKDALKLCGTMLEEKHYDLLLEKTGMVVTPTGEVLCVLLKHRLSPELVEDVQPIVRKAAHKKVAGGNRGVAAGTGMVQRKKRSGAMSKMKGAPHLQDLSDEDFARLLGAKDGTFGFSSRGVRGGQVY